MAGEDDPEDKHVGLLNSKTHAPNPHPREMIPTLPVIKTLVLLPGRETSIFCAFAKDKNASTWTPFPNVDLV